MSAMGKRAARLVQAAAVVVAVAVTFSSAPKADAGAVSSGPLVSISDPTVTGPTRGLIEAIAPRWRAAGVDVASVTADWGQIAPDPTAKNPPAGFDGSAPSSPGYNWDNLDRVIRVLRDNRIEPMLTITGPGPLWTSADPQHGDPTTRPDAKLFAAFAKAVALRYGATVDRYIIWYEPNDRANLTPQYSCTKAVCEPRSPQIYRTIFNEAVPAIRGADSTAAVYAGGLAATGDAPKSENSAMPPVPWIRSFACLDGHNLPERTSLSCKSFTPSSIDGFAHHPAQRGAAPERHLPSINDVGISDTSRLIKVLDAAQASGGVINHANEKARIDLYYTEFGYQTNPPDVLNGVSFFAQDRWLQQAAAIAYRQPRVRLLGQYLWRDQPIADNGDSFGGYSGTQSGLYMFDGTAKPAATSFTDPFWVSASAGKAHLWGQVRPGAQTTVTVDRQIGSAGFKAVQTVSTDTQGNFTLDLPMTIRSSYRYFWSSTPNGRRHYSSTMSVTPR